MNSLYKRLVTIGMISFTALLGWIYCIIEFRNKPVYVICVSIALIVSVYVLLRSVISLRQRKDKKLKKDIYESVAKLVADFYEAQAQTEQPDNSLEVERICKALYVQLRKVNTTLSNDLITKEILNNATKVNIKYHHADSTKLLAAISDLSETLKLAPEPQVIVKEVPVEVPRPVETPKAVEPAAETVVAPAPEPVAEPVVEAAPEPVAAAPADDGGKLSQDEMDALIASMTEAPASEPEPAPEPVAAAPADDGGKLSQDEMDALIASMTGASEPEPEPIAEPVVEPAPEPVAAAPADDGGKLSQAEMDALIASMTGAAAPEPEPEIETPANVGASSAEAQSFFDEFETKHEHNKSHTVKEPEPVAAAPADDGGVLSQAELDALLASMTAEPESASEPEPEPEPLSNVLEFPTPAPAPEPVTDDPNKVLSPEEIAALFNSMK